jgi:hypothetical protein
MSEDTIRELLRSTENTLSERFRVIEDLLRLRVAPAAPAGSGEYDGEVRDLMIFKDGVQNVTIPGFIQTFAQMNNRLAKIEARLEELALRCASCAPDPQPAPALTSLVGAHPLEGLEVIPKREVVLEAAGAESISKEDRLLLNRTALKALEAEEMGESGIVDHPMMVEEGVADSEDEAGEAEEEVSDIEMVEAEEGVVEEEGAAEEEEGEEAEAEEEGEEAEAEEEVAEEEAEEVELEEFEYRGVTYYRDAENNVFGTDADGELVPEPIGVWNEAKQRIVVKKPAA